MGHNGVQQLKKLFQQRWRRRRRESLILPVCFFSGALMYLGCSGSVRDHYGTSPGRPPPTTTTPEKKRKKTVRSKRGEQRRDTHPPRRSASAIFFLLLGEDKWKIDPRASSAEVFQVTFVSYSFSFLFFLRL